MRVGNESWEWEQMRTWNGMRFGNESWELGMCMRICACPCASTRTSVTIHF